MQTKALANRFDHLDLSNHVEIAGIPVCHRPATDTHYLQSARLGFSIGETQWFARPLATENR